MPRKIHLTLALSFGILFAILGVTGSILVFRAEIKAAALPVMAPDYLDHETLSPDQLVARLANDYPGMQLRAFTLPEAPRAYYGAVIRIPGDGKMTTAHLLLDPLTGGSLPMAARDSRLERMVYDLHANMMAGQPGNILVGLTGIAAVFLVSLGLVMARPRRGRLRQALTLSGRLRGQAYLAGLHRVAGLYASPLLLLLGVGGILLVFRGELVDPLALPVETADRAQAGGASECRQPAGLEDYIFQAEEALPGAVVTHLKLPRRDGRPVTVTLRQTGEAASPLGLSQVVLEAACAYPLKVRDGRALTLRQTLTEWLVALHNGQAFGPAGRLGYALGGLVPLLFLASGLVFWRARHRRRKA